MRERQAQIVAEARERTDQITASTDEARTTELETQHDTAMAEYDRLETLIQREEHVAELEARAAEREEGERSRQRPNGGDRQAPAGGGGAPRPYDQAFVESLRPALHPVDDAPLALPPAGRHGAGVGT